MDYGVSNPTAWLAAALSPDGDTVIYGEYYSTGLVTEHSSKILTLREVCHGVNRLWQWATRRSETAPDSVNTGLAKLFTQSSPKTVFTSYQPSTTGSQETSHQ
jgi:hypothetical protein